MHIQKSLAKAAKVADESAPVYENDMSVLVGIGHKILILLKCIVGLVCLVLFGIVYIVSRL